MDALKITLVLNLIAAAVGMSAAIGFCPHEAPIVETRTGAGSDEAPSLSKNSKVAQAEYPAVFAKARIPDSGLKTKPRAPVSGSEARGWVFELFEISKR